MSNKLLFSLILLKILIPLQASKKCDFSECNHEGQCYLNDKNEKLCTCIGTKYFKGSNCSEPIDNCQTSNPCRNGGKCKNIVGQYICEECNPGFSGTRCDLEAVNIFEKMLIYFNHYGYYGEKLNFLIMVESVGEKSFSLEFDSDNYAIANFETKPQQTNKWIYTEDLVKIIKSLKIRYYQDLSYNKGYYHIASQTFWNMGLLKLNLRSYDTETAEKLYYQNQFELLLVGRNKEECVPQLSFIHGLKPLEPLTLDIASYNNFEIILKKQCFKKSLIHYEWSVYDSIGSKKLHDYGRNQELILKIQPYKLWFHYHGEVMASYRIVVKMIEEYRNEKRETETRCYILVLPKPVAALIKGGNYREIGIKQDLILDASNSRDFALAPNTLQELLYRWDCVSKDDTISEYCKRNMGFASILKIKSSLLQLHKTYNFSLTINSKVNKLVSDQTFQIIKIMENSQLNLDIKCLRNCLRNEFVQGDIVHLKAVNLDKQFSESVTFQWILKDQAIGERENLIYKTQETDDILELQVLVQDVNESGRVFTTFKVNLPPSNGSCLIHPSSGEAFLTSFQIKCENYLDKNNPLSYEYLEEKGFPLQRTNEAEIYTKLTPSNAVVIKICDQFQACIETKVEVKVKEMEDVIDWKEKIRDKEGGIKTLLFKGDILAAMILLKSVANFIKSLQDLKDILHEMESFEVKTLLQLEQFLEIGNNLVANNLPLTADKAYIFNEFFFKLQIGFKTIIKDQEISSFKKLNYEKSSHDLMESVQKFSYSWENIPRNQILEVPTILASNPLIENYSDLPDFDINIVERIKNWLDITKNLLESFNLMALGAKQLYTPWEDILSIKKNNINFLMYAFDNSSQQEIYFKNNSLTVILNQACIKELQDTFSNKEILIQMASLDSNTFWWYPSERPLNSEVFLFSALSRKSTKSLQLLQNPFEFKLQLKPLNSSCNEVLAVIKNNAHMLMYTLELPANAVLVLTFLKLQKPLKFLIQIRKPPRSFQLHQSGNIVKSSNTKQNFTYINPLSKKSQTFLALLMEVETENNSFSFTTEIRECLYWDFSLKDPQWSSQGCKPKRKPQNNNSLSCLCHHFSAFSGRSYQASLRENLNDYIILKELSLNKHLIIFYISLIILSLSFIINNLNNFKNHKQYLPINSSTFQNKNIEVSIYTGSPRNASTSANISLRIISQKGPFTLNIYQNPENPFLKRNSLCKFLLSTQQVHLPAKLSITNDLSGRYPSWFCHKIIIKNFTSKQLQIFNIDQWICQQPLEIISSDPNSFNFKQRFLENLSEININWYQFQPLWGCWQYNDLNRLERCCIWLCQFMASVGFVASYFGSTTLETYEEERDIYYYLNFNLLELFLLAVVCYVLNFIILIIYKISIWLLERDHRKSREKFKKIV